MELFECVPLRATISKRQCEINRKGYRSRGLNTPALTTCQGCVGLGSSAHITLPVQEEVLKKKKIECSRSGCGYGVKKEGDFCKKHQEPITTPVKEQKQGLDNQAGAGAVQAEPAQGEALEPKSIAEFDENREETTDAATSTEAATQGSEEIDPAVSAATGDDAAEQVISRPVGLSALLRTPPPSGRAADPVFRGRALHPRRIGSHRGAHSRTRTHGAVRRPAAGGGGIAP